MNNKKGIFLYRIFLIILIVFLLFLGVVLFMLKPILSYLSFSGVCILGSVIIFYEFLKIKIFEYENSMQFISIKQYYFWKLNRVITPIEFPNDKLVSFSVIKILFITTLILGIKSKGQKTKKVYLKIAGLSNGQIFETETITPKCEQIC